MRGPLEAMELHGQSLEFEAVAWPSQRLSMLCFWPDYPTASKGIGKLYKARMRLTQDMSGPVRREQIADVVKVDAENAIPQF
jgi:hypothetical protein